MRHQVEFIMQIEMAILHFSNDIRTTSQIKDENNLLSLTQLYCRGTV